MRKPARPAIFTGGEAGGFFVALRRYPGGVDQPFHLHEGASASLMLRGRLSEEWGNGTFHATGLARVFKPCSARHATRFGPGGATLLSVEAGPDHDGKSGGIPQWARPAMQEWSDGAVLLTAMLNGDREAHIADAAQDFLTGLSDGSRPGDENRAGWLTRLFERLTEETADPVPLTELARRAGVHPSYAARAFRSRYGISPSRHRRRARCLRGLDLLAGNPASIASAAAEAGFADQSHFTRELRLFLGTTPGRVAAIGTRSNPFKTR